ncbi:MAG: hypothetical protein AB7V62_01515 [Thermoleophilia bacterium]
MRAGPRTALAALAAAGALAACAAPGAGASRTVTLDGWSARVLAFSGDRLVWTEAATVRVDPARIAGSPPGAQRFDYYRAETSRIRLDRRSLRFIGSPETPVAVRTSIAAMGPGLLVPTGAGNFLALPSARRFATPLLSCCDAEGLETVIVSDGRPDAPVTLAASQVGTTVHYVQAEPGGGLLQGRFPDAAPAAVAPGGGGMPLVAMQGALRVQVDPAQPTVLTWRDGAAVVRTAALPGPALRLWADGRTVAVAVRAGGRVQLLRVGAGAPVLAWAGARVPAVAVGGGSVAVVDRRRVLASRSGRLKPVATSRRVVDAVGVQGARIAWVERGTRKGARVGVVRLGRVR